MKFEVMVTAHCYKTVYAENKSEAIDKALFMVEDSDFEIDGAEITYISGKEEPQDEKSAIDAWNRRAKA